MSPLSDVRRVDFALRKLGGRGSVVHVAATAGLRVGEVRAALDHLALAGVVSPDGDEWRINAATLPA